MRGGGSKYDRVTLLKRNSTEFDYIQLNYTDGISSQFHFKYTERFSGSMDVIELVDTLKGDAWKSIRRPRHSELLGLGT